MKYNYSYLITTQYLGFRFHGFQKQTNSMSLHEMIDKTLSFVINDSIFKSIGMGRTDSKVSANEYYFQLFVNSKVDDSFIESFNTNAPQDIRVLNLQQIDTGFNIIQSKKIKEYHYYFSNSKKNHPFTAPFLVNFDLLNIDQMKRGARLFEGMNYFHKYCTKPSDNTKLIRNIMECKIEKNMNLTGSFFPKESYVLKVKGEGFLRYQIRLMMAALVDLGQEKINLDWIKDSLSEHNDRSPISRIAPGSGLQLFSIKFLDLDQYIISSE